MTFAAALGRARGKDEAYVKVGRTAEDTTPGTIAQTGNPLDLALNGQGFFAVDTARGVRYTRAGNFRLDSTGTIVNADGLAARAKGGGKLIVPPGAGPLNITGDGTVTAGDQTLGALELARFAPGGVTRQGGTLYAATSAPLVASATQNTPPLVVSGALEQSNFNIVQGVVDMVRIQRTYEALHSMIETYKQIDEQTAQQLGAKS